MAVTEGRTDRILAGLREQNEPAQFDGQSGYWVQGDCVFINAKSPMGAIEEYRRKLAAAQICITHNNFCGSILASKRRDWINAILRDPSLSESLRTALNKDCP